MTQLGQIAQEESAAQEKKVSPACDCHKLFRK
jgi:hypothetical protein